MCNEAAAATPAPLRATTAARHRWALGTAAEEAHEDCWDEPKNIKASAAQHLPRTMPSTTASLAAQVVTCTVTSNMLAMCTQEWAVVAALDAHPHQSPTRGIGASAPRGLFLLPRARSALQSLDPRRKAELRECRDFFHQRREMQRTKTKHLQKESCSTKFQIALLL